MDSTLSLPGLDLDALGAAARALGRVLRVGDVVLLCGSMGAGKTTFTRALAEGLGIARVDRVRSPTFNLCLEHEGPTPLTHVDLFRLSESGGTDVVGSSRGSVGAAAFDALGLEALIDAEHLHSVLAVEWGELWRDAPRDHLRVEIAASSDGDPDRRSIHAEATGSGHAQRLGRWRATLARSAY